MQHNFMQQAIDLARGVLGQTWPNPAVGAVVVKDGNVIGKGATAKGGRPHAETTALAEAGVNAKGATLYVTLEPCSHHGKTPPCTEAIINAGIAECVIACGDPNPKVNGQGIEQLKRAGIKVTQDICSDEARETHLGFFSVIEKGRPFIALKIAASADGKIAAGLGVRTTITGEEAREHAMRLRAEYDAILTGIGTVLIDDPLLTVRIPGLEHRSPVRIVLDSAGRLPDNSRLRQTEKDVPLWTYRREDDVIRSLTDRGITRLLIEGGQSINTHFLESGLVDRLYWYESPLPVGPQGLDAFKDDFVMGGWHQKGDVLSLGKDTLTIFEKA